MKRLGGFLLCAVFWMLVGACAVLSGVPLWEVVVLLGTFALAFAVLAMWLFEGGQK